MEGMADLHPINPIRLDWTMYVLILQANGVGKLRSTRKKLKSIKAACGIWGRLVQACITE
ncbi:hypothetical protein D3C81_1363430 [compost metagenome]